MVFFFERKKKIFSLSVTIINDDHHPKHIHTLCMCCVSVFFVVVLVFSFFHSWLGWLIGWSTNKQPKWTSLIIIINIYFPIVFDFGFKFFLFFCLPACFLFFKFEIWKFNVNDVGDDDNHVQQKKNVNILI